MKPLLIALLAIITGESGAAVRLELTERDNVGVKTSVYVVKKAQMLDKLIKIEVVSNAIFGSGFEK